MQADADVVVVGAGAVGASVARHLAARGLAVTVVEKEPGPGLHQSGRNSGVVHAGYNVKPGSVKARFCVEGNKRLRAYCAERGVPLREGGILVVAGAAEASAARRGRGSAAFSARTEEERATLRELARRATGNGVRVRMLDEKGLREAEPHAAGVEALQAVDGASFDARAYVHALASDATRAGAEFLYDARVLGLGEDDAGAVVRTSKGALRARVVVNAAGLFADRLAGALCPDLRVVPFRGYYAELAPSRRHLVRSHVYAAPDLEIPFLGVHLSRRTDGRVIVGPGAMLAFGREAYSFGGVSPRDLAATLAWPGFWRLLGAPKFRGLVRSEVVKSLRLSAIAREASLLVPELRPGDLVRSYAGNRAQMVSRDGRLVEDVVVRETPRAVHVLNAVSPGLTCSLPFGEHVAERALALLGKA